MDLHLEERSSFLDTTSGFLQKNFLNEHDLNEQHPLTAVTADLEPSALTHLTDKGPSGKCPPYQNLALEKMWMVVVRPPQSYHYRGNQ